MGVFSKDTRLLPSFFGLTFSIMHTTLRTNCISIWVFGDYQHVSCIYLNMWLFSFAFPSTSIWWSFIKLIGLRICTRSKLFFGRKFRLETIDFSSNHIHLNGVQAWWFSTWNILLNFYFLFFFCLFRIEKGIERNKHLIALNNNRNWSATLFFCLLVFYRIPFYRINLAAV